ncbi:MAG: glycine reductase, partial [Tissierellia bacterium]|nr:glycine reductase [Tissierellia bacterium]
VAPPKEVVTGTVDGIDIMELDEAVEVLWAEGIYAESGMGCTGPIVMVNEAKLNAALKILAKAGYDVGEAEDC